MDSNDSPEIPDKGRISDIPGLPSWAAAGAQRELNQARAQPRLYQARAQPRLNQARTQPRLN